MTQDFEKPALAICEGGMKTPLVSVVIPVYNVFQYVSQCLDSVLCQSYQNLEIIVIDDGSTDSSGRICDEYARIDSRVNVLHTENRGLASARNLGLEKASGVFLSFIDSDDWVELDFIERLVYIALETGADVVCVKSCEEYVGRTVPPQKAEYRRVFKCQDILRAFASGSFRTTMWNKLYRVSCFNDIRFPNGHNYEDVSTTWKLMKMLAESDGLVIEVPEALYHFRIRKSSISHTKSISNLADYWKASYEKYEGLAGYQDKLLPAYFTEIGQMWTHYSTFSKKEKREAEPIILEMQAFSREHFQELMRGKYSVQSKMVCLLSQWSNPFIMRLCFFGGKLRRFIKDEKKIMFE